MQIKIHPGYLFYDEIKELFSEYKQMLIDNDNTIADYLEFQHYDDEIDNPQLKYGWPDGRFYLATANSEPVGCIALRRFDETNCEMKRLYVRPTSRGMGIASLLIQKLIIEGKDIGYSAMLLDTMPYLTDAIKLYRKIGFYDIDPYFNIPVKDAIFLKLDLRPDPA